MKYVKLLIIPIIALVIGTTISCERDDICPESTSTTPRLIIEAFDVNTPENSKNIFGLLIVGVGTQNILPGYNIVTSNRLLLPLKTDEDVTQYRVIRDAELDDNGMLTGGNEDIITLNYNREDVYVSRACGFKTVFNNLTLTIEDDGDNWLQSTQDLTNNEPIENENTAHFNIFH